jgi:hypothetical protein
MVIIGICGKMGSGKDYLASKVIIPFIEGTLKQKCIKLCLADQIKVNVVTKNNVSFDQVFVEKTQDTRRMLQLEGTDKGRNKLGQDIWIKYLHTWSRVFENRGIDHVVTCDVRFKNEMNFIKSNGGVLIKVVAPERNMERLYKESGGDQVVHNILASHISECDLDDVSNDEYDIVVSNDKVDTCDVDLLHDVLMKKLSQGGHNRV